MRSQNQQESQTAKEERVAAEPEDYRVTINTTVEFDFGDAPDIPGEGSKANDYVTVDNIVGDTWVKLRGLLTVMYHEMGHALGLDDDYSNPDSDEIMNGWLRTGTRGEPTAEDPDGFFANEEALEEVLV